VSHAEGGRQGGCHPEDGPHNADHHAVRREPGHRVRHNDRGERRGLQVAVRFTGKIHKITLAIDRPKLSAEDIKKLQEKAKEKAIRD
jgi:hypothetical protein